MWRNSDVLVMFSAVLFDVLLPLFQLPLYGIPHFTILCVIFYMFLCYTFVDNLLVIAISGIRSHRAYGRSVHTAKISLHFPVKMKLCWKTPVWYNYLLVKDIFYVFCFVFGVVFTKGNTVVFMQQSANFC